MKTTRYTRCRSGAVLSLGGLLFLMTACAPKTPKENSSATPAIFPDYKNVVVPCNIAPLNFMMDGASRISADFFVGNEKLFTVSGTNTIKDSRRRLAGRPETGTGKTDACLRLRMERPASGRSEIS